MGRSANTVAAGRSDSGIASDTHTVGVCG
eukprot:COSAG06_NODE_67722_length_251_cov_0.677632_1_plen_28_part_01